MIPESFRALIVDKREGTVSATIQSLPLEELPPGEVLIEVAYSSLNFKDGLAITDRGRILRSHPMVPGIDLAGTVRESSDAQYQPGDQVILTGWGTGESSWGGYAELARTQAAHLVALPADLSLKDAMAIGTAGFTAMLAVMALEDLGLRPDGREVVVSGAAGGVGSIAVALLSQLGHSVVASTGRTETHDYLRRLGAREIIDRTALAAPSKRALESERWAGAVDSVGGDTLAGLLRAMARGASIAVCGNAGSAELHTTVFPLILRGVNLLGIDSNYCPLPRRTRAWERLARELPRELLHEMTRTATLEQLPELADQITRGQIRGRVVIELKA